MMLSLGTRCCCDCRSLAVLVIMLSLVDACFAVCCRSLAVLVLSTAAAAVLAVLVLPTAAAAAVHLLSLSWRCNLVMFASAAAVLVMPYRIDLVLPAAASSIYCWLLSW
ncbi:hypothetical protein MAM1_0294c09350 [Mucor ambiguus]|uniref:Uncharacterized protein n=1 Tax=Mucor ambiguus TaxID=91626 RepID=A0A0C9N1H9_9FUNG|nr:hypothetical protein MAM1_0294c09350 [Mucor ambiguus]